MKTINLHGIGQLTLRTDHWECTPPALGDAMLNIEGTEISPAQQERARYVCAKWPDITSQCLAYVEEHRADYMLEAKTLIDPGVFIATGEVWTVYFDSEHDTERVVGVEFKGEQPFQLIIGD